MKKSLLALTVLLLISGGIIVGYAQGEVVGSPLLLLVLVLLSSGSYLAYKNYDSKQLPVFLGVALLLRVLILLFPESDDIYRYIWEGIIQNHGFNPFVLAPDAPELTHIQFAYHDTINHPDFPTIYWPVAQLLFRFVAIFSAEPIVMKTVLTLFDMGIIVLLLKLLPLSKRSNIMWYLFNPLVLFAVAGEGHLEVVAVFFTLLGYYLYKRKRWKSMFISLGLAVLTKVNFILFVPLLFTKKNWKKCWWGLIPLLLFIPYISEGSNPLLVPFRFGGEFAWNGPLFTLLSLFISAPIVYLLIGVIFLTGYFTTYLTAESKPKLMLNVGILFLLCTPTLHFWYILMITPFLILNPQRGWLLLHMTIFAVGFYFNSQNKGFTTQLGLMQIFAFIPPLCVLLWDYCQAIILSSQNPTTGKNISIVLPLLNEESQITTKISELRKQVPDAEIIAVDGGSTDSTTTKLQALQVPTYTASKGRGIQIAEGVSHTTREIVVILHADTTPSKSSFSRIAMTLQKNPQIVGGACGLQYDLQKGYFPLIEAMNAIKVLLFGISFGDQMQFFRRSALENNMPDFFLMEDMEIAMRLKEAGKTIYLPRGVEVSSRRWVKHGFTRNFVTVIRLVLKFLFLRQVRAIDDRCESFYKEYYRK